MQHADMLIHRDCAADYTAIAPLTMRLHAAARECGNSEREMQRKHSTWIERNGTHMLIGLHMKDEPAAMDGGKCICLLRGVRPFLSRKYDITKHPRYKYLSDADKKNAFDTEKYLVRIRRPKAILKPDEVFDFYEGED